MTIIKNLFKNTEPIHLLANANSDKDYFPLDLSVVNVALVKINTTNHLTLEAYIQEQRQFFDSKIAFGGYLEKRNLYQRSSLFKNNNTEERNIHIGIDLWTQAGTAVICPLDGWIHSFKNNATIGDYGPTIILKHQLENDAFYTLYGHLSLKSIENLKTGMPFKKGQQLASLGNPSENGDYAPHLHFQIIKNIENYNGDYPGVCRESDLDFYLENCPDPNLLLKIKKLK
ncbi:peptidase M23 [Flavobacterium sufflavum]|uniref:Peptidase M23 n=1 Tax=Flavobacterium sufflavum TaxID=1921138 RepID=A0A3S2V3K6_9FLAO|nr:peptidoglycan DD-metalloendopeptidase family protein [Flavobacterium sufflavum]RVT75350.1 peptidase M23 [Flavobacterium sufflavum]